mgnify:CR=1 FL=1
MVSIMIEQEFELKRYDKNGEKTGWTFIEIPSKLSQKIKPDTRTTYRVKGFIDSLEIKQVAVIPIGEGDFILPVNAEIRRTIRKEEGQKVNVRLEFDGSEFAFSGDFLACLEDDPRAMEYFETLTPGHQRYFSKWIESAKTIETKTKRITQALYGLGNGMGYPEMIRYFKGKR